MKATILNLAQINELDIRDGGLTYKDALDLLEVARKIDNKPKTFVEVGSWKGYSTFWLASYIKDYQGIVYAIDHWKGSEEAESKEKAKENNIYSIFKKNIKLLGVDKIVRPVKKDSIVASKMFEDRSVDLVFIDGDHRYQNFMNDVMTWIVKVKDGGIICGHDCENKYNAFPYRLRRKFGNTTDKDFILGRWHPGIIKGLYDLFQDDYELQGKIWYKKIKLYE